MTKKIILYALLICAGINLVAADGDLDTTFNPPDGFVESPLGEGVAVAIQTNGDIVVTGFTPTGNNQVIRYAADGASNTVLATDALVGANDILIQPDGKILIAGSDGTNFALIRYNSDGSPDTTFGGGTGRVTTPIGQANAVILQPDGKIVVGGTDATNFKVVRYNSDGSGATVFTGTVAGEVTDLALQADGKIIAGGISGAGNYQLVRYNANGTIDTSYGAAGIATGPAGDLEGIVIQSDGYVVAGGTNAGNFRVARFTTAGFLDTAYGTASSGVFTGPAGTAQDVVLQSDGKAVLLGYTAGGDWQLVRYNVSGSQELVFEANPQGTVSGGALQEDGKILAVGTNAGGTHVQLARYESSPEMEDTQITSPTTGSSFTVGTSIEFEGTAQNPSNVYILIDGVVVGGVATSGTNNTWTFSTTINTTGTHTVQAISIYEDGNVDIESDVITITITPEQPTEFAGTIRSSVFLNGRECILTLTWEASPTPNIVEYQIFRDGIMIGKVASTADLEFIINKCIARCANCCTNPAFKNITLVAIDSNDVASEPLPLENITCS